MKFRCEKGSEQSGFTILEVMAAIVVLSIGILTVVAAFATAVATTQNAQENLVARQKALETLESIFTARNTQQVTFAQIANIPSGGIFTSGATPLWSAGNDGLVNTADDVPFPAQGVCGAGPECITLPGPDGILGTPDDTAMSLGNFTRQIEIDPVLQPDGSVNPNLKQVIVTVSYSNLSPVPRSYTVTALISSYR
ncbi:MAG TPA: prepilin-type N-terminal cleavage/methylation domain-containing protein [Candidatus Sulfotelmatobacter sp.]|nr:prepilin-type N-terminal cleavage/methylation domain-containing protein [Candidatus Sulfotelmatobacter sp.]